MRKLIFLAILLVALPLLAADEKKTTSPVRGHDKGNMEHPSPALNDTVTPGSMASAAAENPPASRGVKQARERVWRDASRLAGLLSDVQRDVPISEAMWRTIANEANTLANRIYARTSGAARTNARDLRMHVREMRKSALAGDAAGARRHAGEALPFAYRIIDWAND